MFSNKDEEYFKREFKIKNFKPKKIKIKTRLKTRMRKIGDWCSNNSELLIAMISVGIPAVTTGVKVVSRHVKLNKEKELKELYCYDPSLGHYWRLKRPLKNSDWTKIDARRKKGERLGTILNDLKVLK